MWSLRPEDRGILKGHKRAESCGALGLGTEVFLRDQEGRVVWSLRSGDRGILKGHTRAES